MRLAFWGARWLPPAGGPQPHPVDLGACPQAERYGAGGHGRTGHGRGGPARRMLGRYGVVTRGGRH